MTAPVETPNAATTTRPERSSTRVAHKAPLGWLPWLALLLLALLIAGIVIALLAARDDSSSDSSSRSSSSSSASSSGTSSGSKLAAVTTGALVGGAGVAAADAPASSGSAAVAGLAGTVLFAEDSAALDADAQRVITTAAQHLKSAGITQVEVQGYTDVVAGQPVNQQLSEQRADAVATALRDALPGVSITPRGLGEKDPVATNSTDQGRQQNRRVAIVARG
jgi:outer membrane protein OmpA-like peptidoglycan-associated protein